MYAGTLFIYFGVSFVYRRKAWSIGAGNSVESGIVAIGTGNNTNLFYGCYDGSLNGVDATTLKKIWKPYFTQYKGTVRSTPGGLLAYTAFHCHFLFTLFPLYPVSSLYYYLPTSSATIAHQ